MIILFVACETSSHLEQKNIVSVNPLGTLKPELYDNHSH
jgi:hypothetical protein